MVETLAHNSTDKNKRLPDRHTREPLPYPTRRNRDPAHTGSQGAVSKMTIRMLDLLNWDIPPLDAIERIGNIAPSES
jgi:hypothetical protein